MKFYATGHCCETLTIFIILTKKGFFPFKFGYDLYIFNMSTLYSELLSGNETTVMYHPESFFYNYY